MQISIRSYLRLELEQMVARANSGLNTVFSIDEIDEELERRADLNNKTLDRLNYPDLSHS